MKNPIKLLILTLLVWSFSLEAKKHKIDSLNLSIDLDEKWSLAPNQELDAMFMKMDLINQEALILGFAKQPLYVINSQDDIPTSLEEFKSFYQNNYLPAQKAKMTHFMNERMKFHDMVEINGFTGPVIEVWGSPKDQDMQMMIWMAWSGHGVYQISAIKPNLMSSDNFESLTIRKFKKLLKSIRPIDKKLNVFKQQETIEHSDGDHWRNADFGIQMNAIEGYRTVSNSDLGVPEDEYAAVITALNDKNGNTIILLPVCIAETQNLGKTASRGYIKSLTDAVITEHPSQLNGKDIMIYSASGVSEEFQQLAVQAALIPLDNCQYLGAYLSSSQQPDQSVFIDVFSSFQNTDPLVNQPAFSNANQNVATGFFLFGLGEYANEHGGDPEPFYHASLEAHIDPGLLTLYMKYLSDQSKSQFALNYIKALPESLQKNQDVQSWKAWFEHKTEDTQSAIATYRALHDEAYYNEEDLFTFVELLSNQGLYEEAATTLSEYLDQVNKRSTALAKLVKIAGQAKIHDLFEENYQLLVDEKRINIDNVYDIMDGLYELDDRDRLRQMMAQQLEQSPDHVGLIYYQGDVLTAWGEKVEALTLMERALALSPNNQQIIDYVDMLKSQQGLGNFELISKPIKMVAMPKKLNQLVNAYQPKHPNDDAEYLYQSTGYHFQKGQPMRTTWHKKIKINNVNGVSQFKTITFDFDTGYENAHINHLKVLDEDGQLLGELDLKTVYLSNQQDEITADEGMTIHIPVPHIKTGVFIDYAITTETKAQLQAFPYDRFHFIAAYPSQNRSFYFQGDVEQIDHQTKEPVQSLSVKNQKVLYSENIQEYIRMPYLPDIEQMANWLIINQKNLDWDKVGQGYLSLIDEKIKQSIGRGQRATIFSGQEGNRAKVIAAAEYVQQTINYQALEFGSRAQIPNPAEMTLKNKYGDCKDHAVLLHDLLLAEGIGSELVLVDTRKPIIASQPSLDQFDHMVVYVPEMDWYLDTTDKDIAFGDHMPPQSIQGKRALRLNPQKAMLHEVPRIKPENNQIRIEREIQDQGDYIHINELVTYTGYLASNMRGSIKSQNSSDLDHLVQTWFADSYSDLELVSFDYFGLENNQKPLILEVNGRIKKHRDLTTVPAFFEKNYLDISRAIGRAFDFEVKEPWQLVSQTKFAEGFKPGPNTAVQISQPGIEIRQGENKGIRETTVAMNYLYGSGEEYNQYVDALKSIIRALEHKTE